MHRKGSAGAPASILILKPSSLGDIVHTLPAAALLKQHWPEACLRWLINREWAPLLAGNPHVDEVLIFPRDEFRGFRGGMKIAPWARQLRRTARSALVLDFQGLLRSALLARLCRGEELIGLSDAREGARFFYDRIAEVSRRKHAVDRYLALVASLGIAVPTELDWPLPEGTAPAGFDFPNPFVLLHPFSRGAGKSLALEQVREFCDALRVPVVLAGRAEVVLPGDLKMLNLLNRTSLLELIWLIRRAAFVVSVDSGPMHIASALSSNLLSLHTWSDPRKVGPYDPAAWVWKAGVIQQKNTSKHFPAPGPASWAEFVAAQIG